ncbi:3161_t:CDS:1, partial [Funneliformis geosporum]
LIRLLLSDLIDSLIIDKLEEKSGLGSASMSSGLRSFTLDILAVLNNEITEGVTSTVT